MEYGKKLPHRMARPALWILLGRRAQLCLCGGPAESQRGRRFYGEAPGSGHNTLEAQLANLKAPVVGIYAGNDARIGATVPATQER